METNYLVRELKSIFPGSISHGKFWIYRYSSASMDCNILTKPGKLNAMAIIICTEGKIGITCNFRNFELTKDMIFISQPNNTLNITWTQDCKGYIIATEESALTDYTIDPKHIPELFEKVYNSPMVSISHEECSRTCKAIDTLTEYIRTKSETPFKNAIIKSGMNTFAYIFADILYAHMPTIEYEMKTQKREKEHFNRFMKLLSENYTKEREVSFYADKMNLTPRYLTTTIRKVSGYTVSEWIYRFIIKDAKYLLKHTDLTVQQVAYELNFPNQSFFGKFFKKHTGMSPGSYRNTIEE